MYKEAVLIPTAQPKNKAPGWEKALEKGHPTAPVSTGEQLLCLLTAEALKSAGHSIHRGASVGSALPKRSSDPHKNFPLFFYCSHF